ncbi:MAG: hypothetical protein ACR2GW_13290 [Pyrinomonadaceae bacterium]
MFTLETTNISKAIENAKALHPKVRMVSFGEYQVSGSTGNAYTVLCYRAGGKKIVDCNCQTRDSVACKHGVAAVSLHIALAAQRRDH